MKKILLIAVSMVLFATAGYTQNLFRQPGETLPDAMRRRDIEDRQQWQRNDSYDHNQNKDWLPDRNRQKDLEDRLFRTNPQNKNDDDD